MTPTTDERVALSLFSGAGNSGTGVERAGHRIYACLEKDPDAVATLRLNGRQRVIKTDIRTFAWEWLKDRVAIDLVEGGPPCQPFSQAGKGFGQYDERDCIPDFVSAVLAIRPRMFLMENVRALTFKKHREYLETVLASFPEEYQVDWRVLSAEEYGVPQTRQRLFVVGRLDGEVVWPEPTHRRYRKGVGQAEGDQELKPWVSMAEALGWGMTARPSVTVTAGSGRTGGPAALDGGSGARLAMSEAQTNGAWRSASGQVLTLTASMDNGSFQWVHERPATTVVGSFCPDVIAGPGYRKAGDGPRQNAPGSVKVTPEEAAILQDFPSDWKFAGSKSSVFRQIGNACPAAFSEAIVRANTPCS